MAVKKVNNSIVYSTDNVSIEVGDVEFEYEGCYFSLNCLDELIEVLQEIQKDRKS